MNNSYHHIDSGYSVQVNQNRKFDALYDFVCSYPYKLVDDSEYEFEHTIKWLIDVITNRDSALLLYTIYHVYFTSSWELYRTFKISSMYDITDGIKNLEKVGFLTSLTSNDQNYKLITTYWKTIAYPTSPRTPKLYVIDPCAYPVIEAYSASIRKRYAWRSLLKAITDRKRSFQNYKDQVEQNLREYNMLESEALGRCYSCNGLIRGDAIQGTHFHRYNVGLICDQCARKATPDDIVKWIRTGK